DSTVDDAQQGPPCGLVRGVLAAKMKVRAQVVAPLRVDGPRSRPPAMAGPCNERGSTPPPARRGRSSAGRSQSGRNREREASPEAQAVRRLVSMVPSSNASGAPLRP